MLEMMVALIIRMSNTVNTLTQKIPFQLFIVIVLCASKIMWKDGLTIFQHHQYFRIWYLCWVHRFGQLMMKI